MGYVFVQILSNSLMKEKVTNEMCYRYFNGITTYTY